MGLFDKFMFIIKGKKDHMEKDMEKNPLYWDGLLAQKKEEETKCIEAHENIKALLQVEREKLETLEGKLNNCKIACKNASDKYKETNDEKFLKLSKGAFNQFQQLNNKLIAMKEKIKAFEESEKELGSLREKAGEIIAQAEINIEKNKARIETINAIDGITHNVVNLKDMEIGSSDTVAKDYYKSTSKLKDINFQNEIDSYAMGVDGSNDDNYESFLKEMEQDGSK